MTQLDAVRGVAVVAAGFPVYRFFVAPRRLAPTAPIPLEEA